MRLVCFEDGVWLRPVNTFDWVFVKLYLKDDPKSADSYRFAPHFARTMNEANEAFDDPLSDHAAISIDLRS
jgi:hypothetical protein